MLRMNQTLRAASRAAIPRRRLLSTLRPFLVEQYDGWFDGSDSLSSSECQPMTMRELLSMADDDSRRQWIELSLGYPAFNTGSKFLRDTIAQQHANLSADDGVNVCAPQEGISLAMKALLTPGDRVIATTPCYQSLTEVAKSIGCDVTDWNPAFESGRAWFDVEVLSKLLAESPSTKLVIANFPHNPTGALPSLDEFNAIIELCRKHGCKLFVDEMYRGLEHGGASCRLPSVVDAYPEGGMTLNGLSKSYGLPGLRIGWLACHDKQVMKDVSILKDYHSICPPVPSEVLAHVAISNRDEIQDIQQRSVVAGLEMVKGFMKTHEEHFEWLEPSGGTFCFPKLRKGSTEMYAERLRVRSKLMVMPSSKFEAGDERLRVCYGSGVDVLGERLGRWSVDLRGAPPS